MLPLALVALFVVAVAALAWRRSRTARALAAAPTAPGAVGRFVAARLDGDDARDYKLYLPATRRGPLPLVVMLHGCLQDPDDFAAGTAMNELADAGPFYVVYPQQPRSANPRGCWNWFRREHQERDRGEPGSIVAVVRAVMAAYEVDPDRVYVAGLSSGAAMAVILAATHPDLFAAAGVHSGVAYKAGEGLWSGLFAMHAGARDPRGHAERAFAKAGDAARAVPLLVFHGDRDRVTRVANAHQIASQWARLGELAAGQPVVGEPAAAPATSADGRRYTRTVYRDAAGATLVEKWIVHGLGHAWSGGRAAGSFTDASGPSASAEMARFFAAHPRPARARLPAARRGLP